jgi:ADP-ribosylglycohydrolase
VSDPFEDGLSPEEVRRRLAAAEEFERLVQGPLREKLIDSCAAVRVDGLQRAFADRAWTLIPRIKALLADDSPVVRVRGARSLVFEVRAHALTALQDLYRLGETKNDIGAVPIRATMSAAEVNSRAHLLLATMTAAERDSALARAVTRLEVRVQPTEEDWELCRNYCLLQDAGLVDYQLQESADRTYITPLQEAIFAGQVSSERPRPNLRVALRRDPKRTLGWFYRGPHDGEWYRDFSDHPIAREALGAIGWWHRVVKGGVPRLRFNWLGKPKRHLDRSFVIDGVAAPTDPDPTDYLRSIGAFLAKDFAVDVNLAPLPADAATAIERARMSLDGLSVGDAFGEQFFRAPGGILQLQRRTSPAPWPWTDDTQMALSIVDVLAQRGAIDQDELARQFAARYEPHRGYGAASHQLLQAIRAGQPWRESARGLFDGQGSLGNGAAMRVAPLGAFFADDLDRAAREAALSAEITHAHPDGVAGAVAVAVAAALIWRSRRQPFDPRAFLAEVAARTPAGAVRDGIERAAALAVGSSSVEAGRMLGNGSQITAADTVPFALWCAAHHVDRCEEALWVTATALGDVDTTCAIVGGLVVLRGNSSPLPDAWLAAREALPS